MANQESEKALSLEKHDQKFDEKNSSSSKNGAENINNGSSQEPSESPEHRQGQTTSASEKKYRPTQKSTQELLHDKNRSHSGRQNKRSDNRNTNAKDKKSKNSHRPNKKERKSQTSYLEEQKKLKSPSDLRRSNQTGRDRSPEIDDNITGKELDRSVLAELRGLNENNAKWASKHLAMAHRLIEEDPKLAFEHALAASRRGGRLALVREAVGLTAYRAELYNEAVRELRTYRRMSGDQSHLPLIVDSERGRNRPARAVELFEETDLDSLAPLVRVELVIVAAGAYADLKDYDKAVEICEKEPTLRQDRAFSFSPKLFEAYSVFLGLVGQSEKSQKWEKLARKAQHALDKAGYTASQKGSSLDSQHEHEEREMQIVDTSLQ